MSVRDVTLEETFDIKFTTTAAATGAPTQLAGSPVISAYPGNSTTQLTAGITLTVDFDAVTGLNNVRVVATAANGYASATDYALVITTGTVGGTSAVGYVVGHFTIGRAASFTRLGAPAGASIAADLVVIDNFVDGIESTLGTPAGASIAADLLVIDNFVDGLESTIGAAGAGLTAVPWNAAWDAEAQSEVEDALIAHRLDELLNADSDIDGVAPPTVGSVFHELMTKTAGSFTYDQTTDSLEAVRDHVGDGTNLTEAGGTGDHLTALATQASVTAIDDLLDSEMPALTTAVADIPTVAEFEARTLVSAGYASPTNITAGTITTVTNLTNAPTVGDLTAAMKASVKAEVVDSLNADTYAEPGQGTPGATISLAQKIGYLFKAWRNRTTQTATEYALYADDAVTKDQEAAVSDNGTTLDRGEVATGL